MYVRISVLNKFFIKKFLIFIEKKITFIVKIHFIFQKYFKTPLLALERKKAQYLPFCIIKNNLKKKKMITLSNEKQTLTQLTLFEEEKIQVILQHCIRTLKIKL
ncbi:hypothetical protein RFI_32633 [Reticulomyxa filosa]|uniref:Uncharacterized protein n=1 Tax=Reticulomyxa filosa TaxID=46433 RepID=X6LSZ1_RETFI|nr:hypothetical protein RFI_32633 [Reticulomyxa filosa]|eukprot:ETO04764.1 hypothetical protein RFI_32633 [Reticulomyxa filosa]